MPAPPTLPKPGKAYLARRASKRDSDRLQAEAERSSRRDSERLAEQARKAEAAAEAEAKAATALQSSARGYFARRKGKAAKKAHAVAAGKPEADQKEVPIMRQATISLSHHVEAAAERVDTRVHVGTHALKHGGHAFEHGAHSVGHKAAHAFAHARTAAASAAHRTAHERAAAQLQAVVRGRRDRILALERQFVQKPIEEGKAWLFADLTADMDAAASRGGEPTDETVRRFGVFTRKLSMPHVHAPTKHLLKMVEQVLLEMPLSAKRNVMVGALMRTLRGSSHIVAQLIAVLLPRLQRRIKGAVEAEIKKLHVGGGMPLAEAPDAEVPLPHALPAAAQPATSSVPTSANHAADPTIAPGAAAGAGGGGVGAEAGSVGAAAAGSAANDAAGEAPGLLASYRLQVLRLSEDGSASYEVVWPQLLGAPGASSSSAAAAAASSSPLHIMPPQVPLGTRVSHGTRGSGTVVQHMNDGRLRVHFDSGESHRYKDTSLYKLHHDDGDGTGDHGAEHGGGKHRGEPGGNHGGGGDHCEDGRREHAPAKTARHLTAHHLTRTKLVRQKTLAPPPSTYRLVRTTGSCFGEQNELPPRSNMPSQVRLICIHPRGVLVATWHAAAPPDASCVQHRCVHVYACARALVAHHYPRRALCRRWLPPPLHASRLWPFVAPSITGAKPRDHQAFHLRHHSQGRREAQAQGGPPLLGRVQGRSAAATAREAAGGRRRTAARPKRAAHAPCRRLDRRDVAALRRLVPQGQPTSAAQGPPAARAVRTRLDPAAHAGGRRSRCASTRRARSHAPSNSRATTPPSLSTHAIHTPCAPQHAQSS